MQLPPKSRSVSTLKLDYTGGYGFTSDGAFYMFIATYLFLRDAVEFKGADGAEPGSEMALYVSYESKYIGLLDLLAALHARVPAGGPPYVTRLCCNLLNPLRI